MHAGGACATCFVHPFTQPLLNAARPLFSTLLSPPPITVDDGVVLGALHRAAEEDVVAQRHVLAPRILGDVGHVAGGVRLARHLWLLLLWWWWWGGGQGGALGAEPTAAVASPATQAQAQVRHQAPAPTPYAAPNNSRTRSMLPRIACSSELLPAPTRPTTATSSPGATLNSGTLRRKGLALAPCLKTACGWCCGGVVRGCCCCCCCVYAC